MEKSRALRTKRINLVTGWRKETSIAVPNANVKLKKTDGALTLVVPIVGTISVGYVGSTQMKMMKFNHIFIFHVR